MLEKICRSEFPIRQLLDQRLDMICAPVLIVQIAGITGSRAFSR